MERFGDEVRVFRLPECPPIQQPDTTHLPLQPVAFEPNEFYVSDVQGPTLRFHRKTVQALASRLSTSIARAQTIQQRDADLAFVAHNSVPSIFRMAAKPVREGGYGYDPESDVSFNDARGFSRAPQLYAAEAVAHALRTAAELKRAVQVDRNFVQPDHFGVARHDAQADLKALSQAYGTPLHGWRWFKRKCQQAWQVVKHPVAPEKRRLILTVDLPVAQRRVADTLLLQTKVNKRVTVPVLKDAMEQLAANIKGKGPVVPAVQNFH